MKKLIMAAALLCTVTSCHWFDKPKGCMDMNARNYDINAEKDNGTCSYSNMTFYGQYGFYQGIPILAISVSVNGNPVGDITSWYPGGPGNCSAIGTVAYACKNGEAIDWSTTVHLANGASVYGSGTAKPSGSEDCIKVNVTK